MKKNISLICLIFGILSFDSLACHNCDTHKKNKKEKTEKEKTEKVEELKEIRKSLFKRDLRRIIKKT